MKPGTWVTPVRWLANRRLANALDGDSTHGAARTVHSRSPRGPVHDGRVLRAVRHQSHKWLARFDAAGRQGLSDRSRAPHQCPHRIADEVAALICAARRQHPTWGPAKLLAWGSDPGIPPWTCPPSVPPAISWPAAGWSRNVGVGVTTSTPASSRRPPRSPMISGRPTSRATSGPAMASTATR